VREVETVAAFWQHLGFPGFIMQHATPREDSRYRGKPLLLSFEVGFQRSGQISYEWIVPPTTPPNIYADFLKLHGEGIQHLGVPKKPRRSTKGLAMRHGRQERGGMLAKHIRANIGTWTRSRSAGWVWN
jgi:hypothetical protein